MCVCVFFVANAVLQAIVRWAHTHTAQQNRNDNKFDLHASLLQKCSHLHWFNDLSDLLVLDFFLYSWCCWMLYTSGFRFDIPNIHKICSLCFSTCFFFVKFLSQSGFFFSLSAHILAYVFLIRNNFHGNWFARYKRTEIRTCV